MHYWLVKQEPEDYAWAQFVKDRGTAWTGIRNFQARNHLRAMAKGDLVLFYHSGDEKAVVGVARVTRAAYPDTTADEGDWSAVDLAPLQALAQPVTLGTLKAEAGFKDLPLLRQSRLSASPVTEAQYRRICELGGTKP